MVCNSFSKTWMMTGWRLGWLVLPEGTRDAVTEIVEVLHSGVAPFIQQAGIAAIQDTEAWNASVPIALPDGRWPARRSMA